MAKKNVVYVVIPRNEWSEFNSLLEQINARIHPARLSKSAFVRAAIWEKLERMRAEVVPPDGDS